MHKPVETAHPATASTETPLLPLSRFDEVLRSLGYDAEAIEKLRAARVI
jgi:hypothetical protein